MEQNDISSRIVFADRGKVNVEKGVEFAPKFDQNGLIPALAMTILPMNRWCWPI